MARATVQQVKSIVEDIQLELEKLTTIVRGDPEKDCVGIVTEIALLKQRNTFEDRLANVAVGIGSALLVFLLTNGCSQIMDTSTPAGLPDTEAPTPTWMVVVTPEPIPTPTATPTPSLTPESTPTPTPDWDATPAQVVGTHSIIEVTPLGDGYRWATPLPKLETLLGTYAPYGAPGDTQNVRYGPGINYAIRYRLAVGKTVRVYAWLSSLPDEAWLCLDAPPAGGDVVCNEALALVYGRKELGNLEIEDEVN